MINKSIDYDVSALASPEDLLKKLKFDSRGLITAVAQDAETGQILMVAWMNAEAVTATVTEKRGVYYSRSRNALWRKGDTSGHIQELVAFYYDCDADTILITVRQTGAACHTGAKTCFFTRVEV